ncbi:Zinc finger protein 280A [Galemys pyrenaicus]|uniref:Zinc finger protein 280A n=1 Tax=Galemys pyrenaicus TaxID=202257 RepID=A0A8J5ZH60_GALPY|nr:Zinc finger protein 280A [Galemys pyrenaicus]
MVPSVNETSGKVEESDQWETLKDPAYTQQPANYVTPTSKALAISPESQPEWLAMDNPILHEPLLIHKPDPVVNSPYVMPENSSDFLPPWSQCVLGAELYVGSENKIPDDTNQLSMWNVNSVNIKRPKLSDGISGGYYSAAVSSAISPTMNTSTPSEDVLTSSSHILDEVSFPWTHEDDKANFNFMDSDRADSLERLEKTDFSSQASQNNTVDPKKENLIVLLSDFYYGQHKGDEQPEQKTHTIFKCPSCLKVLKNVKFMNHMKHHLELEKQKGDSWEIHTTCQHCHRQFPTPFQLQCHIESVHTTQEPSAVCKICELSFKTDQVLLEHMKDNHKPGEMPYVCQDCQSKSISPFLASAVGELQMTNRGPLSPLLPKLLDFGHLLCCHVTSNVVTCSWSATSQPLLKSSEGSTPIYIESSCRLRQL